MKYFTIARFPRAPGSHRAGRRVDTTLSPGVLIGMRTRMLPGSLLCGATLLIALTAELEPAP